MLDIKKISHTAVYREAYWKERQGHFTGSLSKNLIGEQSHLGKFTQVAITYIEGVAGEILTGKPMVQEFFTSATEHGNAMEPEAIQWTSDQLAKLHPTISVLRNEEGDTHKLILENEYRGVTPDALFTLYNLDSMFDETGTKIKVMPLEVKCPPVHHRYIKLVKCDTPADLKKTEPKYYWQCITQLVYCGALTGYFGAYNPDFTKKGKIITFKAMELRDDIKIFNLTMSYAEKELQKTIKLLSD